jgi:formylglycine-generating enzyme required for sulfatase activity/energy-coupling factor transporter ATP-binding protein EcfA2
VHRDRHDLTELIIEVEKTIFVNHRWWDRPGRAETIHRVLEGTLGVPVFLDSDDIGPGEDITAKVEKAFAELGFLIVVIGPDWFKPRNVDEDVPKIWRDKDDWVRSEIRNAIKKNVPIVPVYVDNKTILKAEQLPDDIKELVETRKVDPILPSTGSKAVTLRPESFHRDLKEFVEDFAKTYKLTIKAAQPDDRVPASAPDLPEKWLEKYLTITIEQHGNIQVPTPEGNKETRSLDTVYYPLQLQTQHHSPEATGTTWWSLIQEERTAVTGGAGSGKSTLLKFIAVQAARLRQRAEGWQDDDRLPSHEELRGLPAKIPVFLNLSAAAHRLDRIKLARDNEILAEIEPAHWLPLFAEQIGLTGEETRTLFETGDVLFVIDMLDEVPDSRDRNTLLAGIVKLQRRYGPIRERNHVIVACRTTAWRANDSTAEFREYVLDPMDDATRDRYLSKWCRAVWEDGAEQVLSGLASAFRNSPAIGAIATNPQISAMLALVGSHRSPPSQRALLYERFVKQGFKEEPLSQFGGESVIIEYLTALAVRMQLSTAADGEPANALNVRTAQLLLGEQLPGNAANEKRSVLQKRGKRLLKALVDYTGLLTVENLKQKANVRFLHRTFQEYLVACHFADTNIDTIVEHSTNPAWSETLALTAGVLARESEGELTAFLESLLGTAELGHSGEMTDAEFAAWAPRVAAASVCLQELAFWSLDENTLAPARNAQNVIVPRLQEIELRTRFAIVEGLGSVRDPRLVNESRWVVVPEGWFLRGSESPEAWFQEKPQACVYVSEYWIQRWPVTVADFQEFIAVNGYQDVKWWDEQGWQWRESNDIDAPLDWQQHRQRRNRPVTGVSWWEAQAYCRWLTEVDPEIRKGWTVHLPTECQWEKAARGEANPDDCASGSRRFPWGNDWALDFANWQGSFATGELAPVGLFVRGNSPFGAWDMAGNIGERCLDGFVPFDPDQNRDPLARRYEHGHAVRGGSYESPPLDLRVTYRFGDSRDNQDVHIGFRCAADRRFDPSLEGHSDE